MSDCGLDLVDLVRHQNLNFKFLALVVFYSTFLLLPNIPRGEIKSFMRRIKPWQWLSVVLRVFWPASGFLWLAPRHSSRQRRCDRTHTAITVVHAVSSTPGSQQVTKEHNNIPPTGRPETTLERQLREFWDTARPFSTATAIMDAVLLLPQTSMNISRIHHTNNYHNETPRIFRHFYQGQLLPLLPLTDNNNNNNNNNNNKTVSPHGQPQQQHTKTNTFRLDLAYRGPAFTGWQSQGHKNTRSATQKLEATTNISSCYSNTVAATNAKDTQLNAAAGTTTTTRPLYAVQDVVEAALEGRDVRVSGRTDAGVHGFGQVARVRMPAAVTADQVYQQLSRCADDTSNDWKCWRVTHQAHSFHPTFDATRRSYVYFIDGAPLVNLVRSTSSTALPSSLSHTNVSKDDDEDALEETLVILATRLNALFQPLLNQSLDYLAVSFGKVKTENTLCTMSHLQAVVGYHSTTTSDSSSSSVLSSSSSCSTPFLAIELTSDRFLRRQIRILVATAVLLALEEDSTRDETNCARPCQKEELEIPRPPPLNDERLKDVLIARDRSLSARAAPPGGLIFVGAEFT